MGRKWWFWGLIAGIAAGWWWLGRNRHLLPCIEIEPTLPTRQPEPASRDAGGASGALKRIEGIGPRVSEILDAAGVSTFAALAASTVERLNAILSEADPRLLQLMDPTTWPEQAALAAAGRWDDLVALQAELKAGRRRG